MKKYIKTKPKKSEFFLKGQEVVIDGGIKAIVDAHIGPEVVILRYNEVNWPFPKWIEKNSRQISVVPIQYEDAPF